MASPSPLVLAPAVAVYINGKSYGLVYDMSFGSDTPRKKVKAIDILQVLELVPTGVDINCSLTVYRLRGGGGIEGAGMAAPMPDIPNENYFTVTLVDLVTKFIIFQSNTCSVESQRWNVAVKQYLMGQVSFSCLNWSNELIPVNG